mgnify:FL=1
MGVVECRGAEEVLRGMSRGGRGYVRVGLLNIIRRVEEQVLAKRGRGRRSEEARRADPSLVRAEARRRRGY